MPTFNGTPGADTITGSPGADSIYGLAGNDRIQTDDGDDYVEGGDGDDEINGYKTATGTVLWKVTGKKTIKGGLGNDLIFGGSDADRLFGDGGNDTIYGESGNDSLDGGVGDDSLEGGDGNDYLDGGDGNDRLSKYLKNGASTLLGGAGSDTIWGGNGNDSIEGGEGDDPWLEGYDGDDTVRGGLGSDSVYGSKGNDLLFGDDGSDSLDGGEGNDSLDGGVGNDSLDGGAGDDTLLGGDGIDSLEGGEGNDSLDGGIGNDTLEGGAGNDSLFGGNGTDRILTGDGVDYIEGGEGNDQVNGYPVDSSGRYTFFTYSGIKTIYGNGGDDFLYGGTSNDSIFGGEGDDRLYGSSGNDSLDGGVGNDSLDGGAGDDSLNGGIGDDTLNGGGGSDSLSGSAGNDALYGGEGGDTLDGGDGVDQLYGGDGNDTYYISNQFQYIYDSAGTDTAYVSASFVKIPSSIEKVIYTEGAQALPYWIDALLPDDASGLRFADLIGSDKTYFYSFPTTLPAYANSTQNAKGWKPFTSTQEQRAIEALSYVSTVLDLRFIKSTVSDSKSTITFSNNDQSENGKGSAGYASYPSASLSGGDVFLDNSARSPDNPTLRDGTYGALTLIHELGHALGLKHPFGGKNPVTGEEEPPPALSAKEDKSAYSVMSYTSSPAEYFLRFSVLDIAALQYMYGPSKTSRTGNDTYTVSVTDSNFIWDGVGTDTITAASCNQGCTIYLTPGYWGYVGAAKAAYITDPGQITVNFGTVIENLIGSAYGDTLVGNDTANSIVGGSGNDTITGGGGNDTLDGGDGAGDVAVFSGVFSSYGIRLLQGGSEAVVFADKTLSRDGVDTVSGFEIFRFADGDKTKAQILAVASPTAVKWTGTEGRDSYTGGAGNDTILGLGGDDILVGGDGADSMDGGAGDDRLEGGSGNDRIDGGEGADTAIFQGKLRDYRVTAIADVIIVTDSNVERDGADTLQRIESIRFGDFEINTRVKVVSQSVDKGTLDRVIELYVAFFNRIPDADGLHFWLTQTKNGMKINEMADLFYSSGVAISSLSGYSTSMTNADFVNVIYRNVLGRKDGADAEGLAYWTGELSSGRASRGTLVNTILDSAHTFKGNATFGYVADLLENKVFVAKQVAIDWGLNYLSTSDAVSYGMAIAKAVTATDTSAAVALVGITPGSINLGG